MKILLGLASVALLTAGCGSGSSSQAASPAPSAPSATGSSPAKVAHTRKPYAPNTGKYALHLGQPRRGQDVISVLVATKRPMVSSNPYQTPDNPGEEFLGAKVRTCVKKRAHYRDTITWSDWEAFTRNGNVYPGWSSSWDDFPTPEYPAYRVLSPGECVEGWLLIPVPKGRPMSKIDFAPGGGETVAEWRFH